jgi:tellurite resistance protein
MIIFGTRGLKSKVSAGSFHCPQCGREQAQHWYKVRNWFALYFIPIIPLSVAGQYIECQICFGTFDTEALDHGPDHYDAEGRKFQAEFQKAMMTTMVLMMLADGKIVPSEVEMVKNIFEQLTGEECPSELVTRETARLEATHIEIKDYLDGVSSRLNDGGRSMVFQAAVLVAQADGEVAQDEERLLKKTYKALGLSKSQAAQIRSSIK